MLAADDFFKLQSLNSSFKGDSATLEAPVFSLSTKKDLSIWEWVSVDGKKRVRVVPSVLGRATIHDKDVLTYVVSCLVHKSNGDLPISKTVRFKAYDYFKLTGNGIRGEDYKRLDLALSRLKGTMLETNIVTNKIEVKEVFGLIEKASLVRKNGKLDCVEVTLSDWLFGAIENLEVLTLSDQYFKLRKPLEKRLYEIAKKHCGNQSSWKISIENLQQKANSTASLKEFKRMLKKIIETDLTPDYRMFLERRGDHVIFYLKDPGKLAKAIGFKSCA